MSTPISTEGLRTAFERDFFKANGLGSCKQHGCDDLYELVEAADRTIETLVDALRKEHQRSGTYAPDGRLEVHPADPADCAVCVLLDAVSA